MKNLVLPIITAFIFLLPIFTSAQADSISAFSDDAIGIVNAASDVVADHNNQTHIDNNSVDIGNILTRIMPFIFVILIVGMVQFSNFQKNKQKTQIALKYLEQGKEVPKELFADKKDKMEPLKMGVIFVSIGIGMFIMFSVFMDIKIASIAAVPVFLGIGFLVVHVLSKRKSHQSDI